MDLTNVNQLFVSVAIITYNQENTIRETIESILNQECDFRFEIIIGDDSSQDNTRVILTEYKDRYPDKIFFFINEINLGLVGNYFKTIGRCSGKYVAQCAGDDYWIDSSKLQKQVDFLESNPEYGLVHTDFSILNEKNGRIIPHYYSSIKRSFDSNYTFENLVKEGCFSALTVMFRKKLMDSYLEEIRPLDKGWRQEDYPFWIYISFHSKIFYLPENTCMYRVREGSVTHAKNKESRIDFLQGIVDIELFFAKKYGVSDTLMNRITINYHKRSLILAYYKNDVSLAKETMRYLLLNQKIEVKELFVFFVIYFRAIGFFLKRKFLHLSSIMSHRY